MKLYVIAFFVILACGYAAAIPDRINTAFSLRDFRDFIASIKVSADAVELNYSILNLKPDNLTNQANKFQNAGFESMSKKYQTLAKEYQVMVNICQSVLRIQKKGFFAFLAQPELFKAYIDESRKLVDGYGKLISAHEDIVSEIQSAGGPKENIIRHRKYSNQYKKTIARFNVLFSKFSDERSSAFYNEMISLPPHKRISKLSDKIRSELSDETIFKHLIFELLDVLSEEGQNALKILLITNSWIETHRNVSKFLKTIKKASFIKKLDDLEKAAAKRIITYDNWSKLYKSLRSKAAKKGKLNPGDMHAFNGAVAAVKKADRAYIEVHPKGKTATIDDWRDSLNDLDKKVLNFQQENRCRNRLLNIFKQRPTDLA